MCSATSFPSGQPSIRIAPGNVKRAARLTRPYRRRVISCGPVGDEVEEEPDDFVAAFLLDPVPRPIDQVHAAKIRAKPLLHVAERSRCLVDSPVPGAGDEAGRNLDGEAGEEQEFGLYRWRLGAAVPLQSTLKPGPSELLGV